MYPSKVRFEFVLDGIVWSIVGPGKYSVSHSDDAKTFRIQLPDAPFAMLIVFRGHFQDLSIDLHVRGELHDLLNRALADQDLLILVVLQNNRHAAALEIERQFVNFAEVFIHLKFVVQVAVVEDGFIHQVFQPGLVIAVHVPVVQHALAGVAFYVQVLFQYDSCPE